METNIDLFEKAVKFLAVKPLKFDDFDFEDAQSVIKKEKEGAVTFIGEHGYFEKSLEAIINKVAFAENAGPLGTLYINIQGEGCSMKIKRRLMELGMNVRSIIIFGDPDKWPNGIQNVRFTDKSSAFADNHQRFFIYHGPAYNIALISRHHDHNGKPETDAIITNDQETVSVLGVTIATNIYPLIG